MQQTIGTCSICGGPVKCPDMWAGVIPPVPTCANCGATANQHGSVIPMSPKKEIINGEEIPKDWNVLYS